MNGATERFYLLASHSKRHVRALRVAWNQIIES